MSATLHLPEAWELLVVGVGGVDSGSAAKQVEVVVGIEARQVPGGPEQHALAALHLNEEGAGSIEMQRGHCACWAHPHARYLGCRGSYPIPKPCKHAHLFING